MLGIERKQIIINLLKQKNRVYVSELSKQFQVTDETIRRDLKEIEKRGIATRSHGGAVLNQQGEIKPFIERELINRKLKEAIADQLKTLIHDGMVLMVDASTTTKLALERINPRLNLTVITNSYSLINDLSDNDNIRFIATGGECYGRYRAYVGTDAISTIKHYNADLALLSCHSLSLEQGYMESNQLESDVKCTMRAQSTQTIMLADHTKFNRKSLVNSLPLTDVDVLVTDVKPDLSWLNYFKIKGLTLIYPQPAQDSEAEGMASTSSDESCSF